MLKLLITLTILINLSACGTTLKTSTPTNDAQCKKIEYCMIDYHNPPGSQCACVPD